VANAIQPFCCFKLFITTICVFVANPPPITVLPAGQTATAEPDPPEATLIRPNAWLICGGTEVPVDVIVEVEVKVLVSVAVKVAVEDDVAVEVFVEVDVRVAVAVNPCVFVGVPVETKNGVSGVEEDVAEGLPTACDPWVMIPVCAASAAKVWLTTASSGGWLLIEDDVFER
jgi:hypothetical protein